MYTFRIEDAPRRSGDMWNFIKIFRDDIVVDSFLATNESELNRLVAHSESFCNRKNEELEELTLNY